MATYPFEMPLGDLDEYPCHVSASYTTGPPSRTFKGLTKGLF